MSTSMVKGNPLKLMLHFALPLLIGNLLQQTYNIIDAAIVGQILGAKALASVGASSSVQFLVLGFCMRSCTGFGVPVAKYFGGNNLEKMRDYIFNGAVLVGIIAAVVTTICAVFCPQILHLLSVPEDIFEGAYAYLIIIFLGIPFTLMYNYLSGILRSVGDSRTPFMFLAFSACLNIFLDLFCIVVLKWDAVPVLDAGGLDAFQRFVNKLPEGCELRVSNLEFQPLRTLARAGVKPLPGRLSFYPDRQAALADL